MAPAPNDRQDYSWEEIPAFRKHLYFYLLLVLGTLAVDSLIDGALQSRGRLAFAPAPPPRITSQELYPAPVPGLSPKPSDAAQ
jgi:hypothetical protein